MRSLLLPALLLFSSLCSYGQQTLNFLEDFGHFMPNVGTTTIRSSHADSNYFIVSGTLWDTLTDKQGAYVASFQYDGSLNWRKNIRIPNRHTWTFQHSTLIKYGQNFLMLGSEMDDSIKYDTAMVYRPFLYRFSSSGDSVIQIGNWIDDPRENIWCTALTKTNTDQILIAGTTYGTTFLFSPWDNIWLPDSSGIFLMKLDSLGQEQWTKRLYFSKRSLNGTYVVRRVYTSNDGGILLAGLGGDQGFSPPSASHFVIKLDSNGNVLWRKNYRTNNHPEIREMDIIPSSTGGFYFLTCLALQPVDAFGEVSSSVLFYGRCDHNGDTIWTRQFADTGKVYGYKWSMGYSLSQRSNGDLLLNSNVYYDFFLRPTVIVADSNGVVKSYREFGYKPVQYGFEKAMFNAIETPTKQWLLTGYYASQFPIPGVWDSSGAYGWIVLTDTNGCIVPGCQVADTKWVAPNVVAGTKLEGKFRYWPNPALDVIYLEQEHSHSAELVLRNLQGVVVARQKLPVGRSELRLDHLQSGLYLMVIQWDDGVKVVEKVMKR